VIGLARRCNWDEAHARHVARLAGELFDATRRLHRLGPAERELLEHAALLHDIGEHVSVLSHHKHTSYLIQHGRLRGFAPEEVDALAAVARYGSRGVPKASHKPFGLLETKMRERVVKLSALLRVAAALDRGRVQTVEQLDVEQDGPRVKLKIRAPGGPGVSPEINGGPGVSPESRNGDLELWAVRRQAALFQRVFGRRLEVSAAKGAERRAAAGRAEPVGAGKG
jgi:exopolyphosphatase/guanosine-5'-triphosphate,3'-diphosphate pyrophosphatase